MHLVVDVLDHAYIAIDKGQISDTHVLVIAVEHYPSLATLKPEAFADISRLHKALQAACASRGLSVVGFERCAMLQHDVRVVEELAVVCSRLQSLQ